MRVYYIHLQRSDFTLSNNGSFWQSSVIDLYNNNSYTNYSLVRSNYGLGATQAMLGGTTPNNVWVGMQVNDQSGGITYTDSGYIQNNRFVDTTAKTDLVSYWVTTPEYSSTVTLNLFQSNSSSSVFPIEWNNSATDRSITDGLDDQLDADRYIVVQLNWNYDPGDIDFYLRVHVGPPVMTPKYQETSHILNKLPSWMAMSESTNIPTNSALATPTSVGGSFINAAAGEWLDDLVSQVTYRELQLFIDTADITQKAWCYLSTGLPLYPYSYVGDGVACVVANTDSEFYKAAVNEDIIYWNEQTQTVYSNKLYNNFQINGQTYTQELSPLWNSFDDLGLWVNLKRLPGEDNSSFRQRILDVYINQPGVGVEAFKLAIRRELNLWQLYGSTPDSYFVGATPEILEITDLLTDSVYTQPNGLPTTQFVKFVNYLAKRYPTTWGEFLWDSAFADLTDDNFTGYSVLPLMMDATPYPDSQTGVGDLKDLLILPPDNINGPYQTNATLTLRGNDLETVEQYLPIACTLQVQPTATYTAYTAPATAVWFSLEFQQYGTTDVHVASFQLTSFNDAPFTGATPSQAAVSAIRVFEADGGTNRYLNLVNKVNGIPTTGRLTQNNISNILWVRGQWDAGSQSYINLPTSDIFSSWLSFSLGSVMTWNSPAGYTISNTNQATPTGIPNFSINMQSNQISAYTATWEGETHTVSGVLNGLPQAGGSNPAVIPLPNLNFLPGSTNQKLKITLKSLNMTNADGTITALPLSDSNAIFEINNGGPYLTPSNDYSNTIPYSTNFFDLLLTTNITSNATTNIIYPVNGIATSPISHELVHPISITVDANGPWDSGYAPLPGNTNYLLGSYTFEPSDFNISGSLGTYDLSWIGVQSSNDAVNVWLDTNSIEQNADGSFGPIKIYSRVNPQPPVQWNPRMHSGSYFEGSNESYFFISPTYANSSPNTNIYALPSVAQQGAPIIAYTGSSPNINYLQQVAFFDWDATPYDLSLTNTEVVNGTNTNNLYASYPNLINISVENVTDPTHIYQVPTVTSTSSNVITLHNATPGITASNNTYQLTYQVANSFYIDNNNQYGYIQTYNTTASNTLYNTFAYNGTAATYQLSQSTPNTGPNFTVINSNFNAALQPDAVVVTNAGQPFNVIYEGSPYVSATPINIALNPLYTTQQEGFIFLSNNSYTFSYLTITLSPSTLVANGYDFVIATIYTYDIYGNPAPNVSCTARLNYAYFNNTLNYEATPSASMISFTTDINGFATLQIQAAQSAIGSNPDIIDTLTIATTDSTPYVATSNLRITTPSSIYNRVNATAINESIRANGTDLQNIYGRYTNAFGIPVVSATLNWKRARSLYDLFAPGGAIQDFGSVSTDVFGRFQIGMFEASTVPGYWFVAISNPANTAGDVVFWLEYADSANSAININGIPYLPVQYATPVSQIPPYIWDPQNPIYYNIGGPVTPATPNGPTNWTPPNWFALPDFDQWQMNLYQASALSAPSDWSDYMLDSIPPHPPEIL